MKQENSLVSEAPALANLAEIDLTNFDSRIFETEITVACDVNNPLLGKNGASYVYGPQKGGTEEMVEALDRLWDDLKKSAP